ncbi:MAG: chorismate-binding protein [Arachnia sp.]
MDPYVLLDDALAGRAALLTDLVRVDEVETLALDDTLAAGWAEGLHCFAWLPYDLGEAHLGVRDAAHGALYWFARRTAAETPPAAGEAWLAGADPTVDEAAFAASVGLLQEAIGAGTSYQVNYTHAVRGRLVGDPVDLYAALRARQPAAFGVLARLPGPAAPWTMSFSPELFLEVDGARVTARPMKGTASADTPPEALSASPKNRAENLMIVDLLRNDLSRVAVPGTVAAPSLFDVERVGDLWQMTSTVTARLAPGTTVGALLDATFPCGSITGAPKLSSMRLIRAVEPEPRGVYTGSLGIIEPADGPLGWRLRLSVAIRTLEMDEAGEARFGVGSGIVADSTAASEWAECRAKAGFVTRLPEDLRLKEALRVKDGHAPLAELHQRRLSASAAALGLRGSDGVVAAAVADTPAGSWRVGIELAADGSVAVTRTPLTPWEGPVEVLLADAPWPTHELAQHKTNRRAHLDDAWRAAEAVGAFDTIGYDARGRILEGGRSTVFALIDGVWATPPATLGLLPGVQRAALFLDPSPLGGSLLVEREITVDELRAADRIAVANAVRGVLPAVLRERGVQLGRSGG